MTCLTPNCGRPAVADAWCEKCAAATTARPLLTLTPQPAEPKRQPVKRLLVPLAWCAVLTAGAVLVVDVLHDGQVTGALGTAAAALVSVAITVVHAVGARRPGRPRADKKEGN